MSENIKRYRIFIASPGGLLEERKAFRDRITEYNEMDAMERGVVFTPIGWEITLGGTGRPQALINEDIKKCDYFVLLLWDRWGSPPDVPGKSEFSSATQEELDLAWKCLSDTELPMRQIVAFFKAVDPSKLNDPGPQLQKVLDFKQELESSKEMLFHTFDEIRSFEKWLEKYLAAWIRDHEKGHGNSASPLAEGATFPVDGVHRNVEPTYLLTHDLPDPKSTESPGPHQQLLKQAQELADAGHLTEAETRFARAIVSGNDPDAFDRYGKFLARIGRLDQARVMYEHGLSLAEAVEDDTLRANALHNLGKIFLTRGDLPKAEQMLKNALALNEKLKNDEGMAKNYDCLGGTYKTQGELDRAEEMYEKALAINKKLGNQKGMATQYSGLGLIFELRGELDQSLNMHKMALAINEKLGSQPRMARQYNNMGNIFLARNELEPAEKMYKKALVINEKLGRQDGMATQYGNLGGIHQRRGRLDLAEEMVQKALVIEEKLGRLDGMARQYRNLGIIYQNRGELDRAEEMLKKALATAEKLGQADGLGNSYRSLGSVAARRGNRMQAREWWTMARDVYAKVGMPNMVQEVERSLDMLQREMEPNDKSVKTKE